jgi:nicotinate-nucleotide adenylyltransferase
VKVGLFFGSFNPTHVGHLIIANFMVELTDLDQVWLVISPQSPFKKKATLLDKYDRLHLAQLAIGDNDHLRCSSIEFNLPQPSYTVNTLAYLTDQYPQHKYSLLMGSDNLETLAKWKNYETILSYYNIKVYRRKGHDGGEFKDHANVEMVDVPLLNISASFIRQCIKEGVSVQYAIPDKELAYIDEVNLYRQ